MVSNAKKSNAIKSGERTYHVISSFQDRYLKIKLSAVKPLSQHTVYIIFEKKTSMISGQGNS